MTAPHYYERSEMRQPQTPYTEHKLFHTILTTIKPNHYHPNGNRRLTTREIAALQTFPHDFFFEGARQADHLKQIGNAVPPAFAEKLFRHIITELKAADQAEAMATVGLLD
jgi:DNA (cytosine-5)-methyltransferase 1